MEQHLKPTLNTWHLWGLAVGLVISGEYFGWSFGWGSAGTLGFLVVALVVALMYTCFIFSFTELTTAIPHAGGPYAYARRAFGPQAGFVAGERPVPGLGHVFGTERAVPDALRPMPDRCLGSG